MLGFIKGIGNKAIGAGKAVYDVGAALNTVDKIGGRILNKAVVGDRLSHQLYRNVIEPAGKFALSTNIRAATAIPTLAVGAGLVGLGAIGVANKVSGGVDKSYLKERDPLIKTNSTAINLGINGPVMFAEDFVSAKMGAGLAIGAGYGILTSNRTMPPRTNPSRVRQTKYDMGATGELGLALHNMR